MCLIITGKSTNIRSTLLNTNGMLADVYSSNPDGIGIMYATSKGLKVVKVLPKTLADATAFIQKLPQDDRELAIHFRWTTHGNTDMTNCHPYDVIPGYVAMMHNGVLHTGNKADTTKSDTWHFIKDFVASPVAEHPALVHNQSYLDMLSEFIGDNRFVFMDGDGKMSHVNYDQGIEHDGLWFSNTYAWKPSRLIPNYYTSTKYSTRYSKYSGFEYDYDDYDYAYDWTKKTQTTKPLVLTQPLTNAVSAHHANWLDDDYDLPESYDPDNSIALIERALTECNSTLMMDLIDLDPEDTLVLLFDTFAPIMRDTNNIDFTAAEEEINRMIAFEDIGGLLDVAYDSRISSCICYYFDWCKREIDVPSNIA